MFWYPYDIITACYFKTRNRKIRRHKVQKTNCTKLTLFSLQYSLVQPGAPVPCSSCWQITDWADTLTSWHTHKIIARPCYTSGNTAHYQYLGNTAYIINIKKSGKCQLLSKKLFLYTMCHMWVWLGASSVQINSIHQGDRISACTVGGRFRHQMLQLGTPVHIEIRHIPSVVQTHFCL